MVNNELLDILRYKSEGTDLDFKSEQYRFAGGNDFEKSEMLKDILAIANAWRDGMGYILLGLKENRPHLAEVVGISDSIDDSRLQQFVNSKVRPKLTFSYEEHLYEGKTIGVIIIPKQKRPFFIANDYGKLKRNVAYVRRGSCTEEAEPTEVAAMALADSGRGRVLLDLSVLTPDNEFLPETVALKYMSFPENLPNYESPPKRSSPFDNSFHSHIWHDNREFWREYAEYAQVNAALIEMKFILMNRSDTSLSNAKLEVSVKPLDGQSVRMMAGVDLPEEPSKQWSSISSLHSLPEMLDRREARLIVKEDDIHPVCHVRFGSLLPGEEGRSSDTLAIVPAGPGKLKLHFRILAGELAVPQESEHLLEITGESTLLNVAELSEMYNQALLARYHTGLGDKHEN
ncbi:helix-turn-helix domain-containing protein [Lonsdalea quercina]|uniref:AlbA family DNA-binding domain-containing protein n=1 Tax=Lonsdalea quercina TaxID=71657 RepID=UPI003975F757